MSNRGQLRKTRRKHIKPIKQRLGRDQGGNRRGCFPNFLLQPGQTETGPVAVPLKKQSLSC
jgi:hypothetical protein